MDGEDRLEGLVDVVATREQLLLCNDTELTLLRRALARGGGGGLDEAQVLVTKMVQMRAVLAVEEDEITAQRNMLEIERREAELYPDDALHAPRAQLSQGNDRFSSEMVKNGLLHTTAEGNAIWIRHEQLPPALDLFTVSGVPDVHGIHEADRSAQTSGGAAVESDGGSGGGGGNGSDGGVGGGDGSGGGSGTALRGCPGKEALVHVANVGGNVTAVASAPALQAGATDPSTWWTCDVCRTPNFAFVRECFSRVCDSKITEPRAATIAEGADGADGVTGPDGACADNARPTKQCACCLLFKGADGFSYRQWGDVKVVRARCKACIGNGVVLPPLPAGAAACSAVETSARGGCSSVLPDVVFKNEVSDVIAVVEGRLAAQIKAELHSIVHQLTNVPAFAVDRKANLKKTDKMQFV